MVNATHGVPLGAHVSCCCFRQHLYFRQHLHYHVVATTGPTQASGVDWESLIGAEALLQNHAVVLGDLELLEQICTKDGSALAIEVLG